MWHSQTSDIDEMRRELDRHFAIPDYQPFSDMNPLQTPSGSVHGQHSGSQP